MRYLEHERAYWVSGFPTTFRGKHVNFPRLAENNDVICRQGIHGKDEFLQAILVFGPTIPAGWHVHTEMFKRRRIGHPHP